MSPSLQRRLRRLVFWSLGLFVFWSLVFLFRSTLLTSMARSWVVDDPVQKADAIVVLGGRPDLRPFEAARLYHLGVAPRILYMDVRLSPTARLGLTQSEREITHLVLLSNNVPELGMEAIGNGVTSTYDESRAVRQWVETTHARAVIVTTDLFHTRRACRVFTKALKGTTARLYVHAAHPAEYDTTNWWWHEEGFLAFQNEVLKSVYYCFKH